MSDYYLSFKNNSEDNAERFNNYYLAGINILKNLLNLTNAEQLLQAEKRLVALNYVKANQVEKTFDFKHLMAINQALFGNIYPFAGSLREANMGKTEHGETYYDQQKAMFMDYQELPFHIRCFDNYMYSCNFLKGIKDKTTFAKEACEIYLFINDIRAFREGNGRTQNEFIRQLAEKNGFILDIQLAIAEYREKGINYYQWFYDYKKTENKDVILQNLFLNNLKTIREYNFLNRLEKS